MKYMDFESKKCARLLLLYCTEAIEYLGLFITFQFLDTATSHFLFKKEAAPPFPVCSSLGSLATGIYSCNRYNGRKSFPIRKPEREARR